MKSIISPIVQFLYRLRHGITLSNSSLERLVGQVSDCEKDVSSRGDEELRNKLRDMPPTMAQRQAGSEIVEAFAIIREAAARTLSMRPYDVQMLAAFAMNSGKCVEMQTGEGKTLAAAVVVCLKALSGHGVHVLTFNDYLAERDAQWMSPLYHFFGFTVGHVAQGMSKEDRRTAYNCDITYVTAKEAGFDFLRDQFCTSPEDCVQRGFPFAIVDEADSILIDEARIPLVIATEDEKDRTDLYEVAAIVRPLKEDEHYQIKTSGRNVSFTELGLEMLERDLGISELHSEAHANELAHLNLALQAETLLHRDVDYIVRDDAIELIDEFTGRVAENRKWPGGLQAALEAKEGLPIKPQGRILNSITLQHFLMLYDGLSGMTGTAVEATEELDELYRLKVVVIPPNRPCVRVDHPDRIFETRQAKHDALLLEIKQQHQLERPVLVGTASVDETEVLAELFRSNDIPCRVLNAANDHLEAEVVAEAGAIGAVTISTNMAGRGTDICLGGSQPESRERVVALGGLYVIGTNRHESRRIDNQLRGRSGRQGDPGESRFFISLEDPLISQHGIAELVSSTSNGTDTVTKDETAERINFVQRVIEGESFEIRRTLRVYSELLEIQRRTISKDRKDLMTGNKAPAALRKHNPELRSQLVEAWGEELIQSVEREVTLIHLDWCWSDHLAHAAEIRQGIHLVSFGGYNPYDIFNKEMNMEFGAFLADVERKVVGTMETATITADGIDLANEGLMGPSSTWTFMINDNPRGAVLGQILKGIVRRLKGMYSDAR